MQLNFIKCQILGTPRAQIHTVLLGKGLALPFLLASCPGKQWHNCRAVHSLWQYRAESWHQQWLFSAGYYTPLPGNSAPLRWHLFLCDPGDPQTTLSFLGFCPTSPPNHLEARHFTRGSRHLKLRFCALLLIILCGSLCKQAPSLSSYPQLYLPRFKSPYLLPSKSMVTFLLIGLQDFSLWPPIDFFSLTTEMIW